MKRLERILRDHIHCLAITALLILIMTFPTIEYVFRTDVFWLPSGKSSDVFIEIWDVWYGRQVLSGGADRFHTNLVFYPEGVSLVYHPINFPYVVLVNACNSSCRSRMRLPSLSAHNLLFGAFRLRVFALPDK